MARERAGAIAASSPCDFELMADRALSSASIAWLRVTSIRRKDVAGEAVASGG